VIAPFLRWSARIIVIVPLVIAALVMWLLMTNAGARFLLARAAPYIPAALEIGEISGSLVGGLSTSRVAWTSDSFTLVATDVDLDPDLFALWALNVGADSVRAESIEVRTTSSPDEVDSEPFEGFVSPIAISVGSAEVAEFILSQDERRFVAQDLFLSADLKQNR